MELAPQGFGMHGSVTAGTVTATTLPLQKRTSRKVSKLTFRWFRLTVTERIACVALKATTYWDVVEHVANCVYTTRTRAGIFTFFSYTSKIAGAFGIYRAFRSAVWWASYIVGQTRTRWLISVALTDRVWTTRGWNAWIRFDSRHRYRWGC